jgi:DnaJ-class molecular chaperone
MSKRMVSQENSLKVKKLMQQQSLTSDLFGIESCPNCDGSGQIEFIEEERIEDCDICNGDQ